jgi:predicted AAA+ superfamily ATPase
MERYLRPFVEKDLTRKMVFVGGPRQVGKTTLALRILGAEDETHPAYLSWDDIDDRDRIRKGILPARQDLVVLDEIHKYPRWRGLVKGLYDKQKSKRRFLITGSARLDYYRHGGDSLQGRYHYYRLHPLSLSELGSSSPDVIQALLELGGFPEPFLAGDKTLWRRWQQERATRVVSEDLIHLERVSEVASLQSLLDLLPSRVGSLLSIQNLASELEVSHHTVQRWLAILENLYHCFRVPPFGVPQLRALKKMQKLYLWDWSLCPDAAARFENLVASHLLKYCHLREDSEGYRMELRFLRDAVHREIDFVVLQDRRPLFAVECKLGERASPHLRYFAERAGIPEFYQVHLGSTDTELATHPIRVLPLARLVTELALP